MMDKTPFDNRIKLDDYQSINYFLRDYLKKYKINIPNILSALKEEGVEYSDDGLGKIINGKLSMSPFILFLLCKKFNNKERICDGFKYRYKQVLKLDSLFVKANLIPPDLCENCVIKIILFLIEEDIQKHKRKRLSLRKSDNLKFKDLFTNKNDKNI